MLDADIRITRQMEDNRIDETGQRYAILRVEFRVGEDGPFVERFKKDGYTALGRDETLNAFAREVRRS